MRQVGVVGGIGGIVLGIVLISTASFSTLRFLGIAVVVAGIVMLVAHTLKTKEEKGRVE